MAVAAGKSRGRLIDPMERYLRTALIAACLSIHSSFALAQADPPATGVTLGVILIMSVLILITAGAARVASYVGQAKQEASAGKPHLATSGGQGHRIEVDAPGRLWGRGCRHDLLQAPHPLCL